MKRPTNWGVKLENNKLIRNIPNFITITRIIATILFLNSCLFSKEYYCVSVIFIFICVTDIIDGRTARVLGCCTITGGILDVAADTFFIIGSLIVLFLKEKLVPGWFIIIAITNLLIFIITSYIIKSRNLKIKEVFVFDLAGRASAVLFYIIPGAAYLFMSIKINPQFIIGILISISTIFVIISFVFRVLSCLKI